VSAVVGTPLVSVTGVVDSVGTLDPTAASTDDSVTDSTGVVAARASSARASPAIDARATAGASSTSEAIANRRRPMSRHR